MITLYSYPELFGVAANNGYGLKVFAFFKLTGVSFTHEHILDASAAAWWVRRLQIALPRKRLGLSDRLAEHDVIRSVEEALVDLRSRHKAVDLDGVGARVV